MAWNHGDILDALAGVVPGDRPACIHDGRVIDWTAFTRRTNNLARAFMSIEGPGDRVAQGDKVAFYMRNSSAYVETLAASFKARLVHVNVNYRYVDDELWYIMDNADAKIVVYAAEFAEHIRHLRERLPKVLAWVEVEDRHDGNDFAVPFENLAETGDGAPLGIERSGDDMLFLYTGGTTGMPKGVMWGLEALWQAGGAGANAATGLVAPQSLSHYLELIEETGFAPRSLPACPLMHGTGLLTSMGAMVQGGTVVTLSAKGLDPDAIWSSVETHKVTSLVIVGDAFAKPLLRALDENPGRWDISSLRAMTSSGVMWSPDVKRGLLRHNPEMMLIDSFGASEAVGFGVSQTTADGESKTAKFALGEMTKVFTEDFREVRPGSDEIGFVARSGPIPFGYYKDPEKSAKTFPVIDGIRYSMPGDYCKVETDGSLTLLGRGSVSINTGGEKVYPEEIEEVLKEHPSVEDALVVGVPDERWGQAVTAVVQLRNGAELDEEALRDHVKARLAAYKAPKRVLAIDDLGRAANAKADYKRITEFAKAELGIA